MAPFPTIQKIKKEKAVGGLPLLPYSSMVSNAFLWTVYGILKKEAKVWASNGVGFVLGIYYMASFIPFAQASSTLPGSPTQHIQACVAVVLSGLAVAFALPTAQAVKVIGSTAVMICLVLFASPLAALKTVIKSKSAASIPLPFTIATTVNCILWAVYGAFAMKDVAIVFPNSLGLLFGLMQLGLKLKYGSGPGLDDAGTEKLLQSP